MSIPVISSSQSYFKSRKKIICIETQCFNLNKVLLLAVGLWPYQQTKLVRFQFIFFVGILTTLILCQFTAFLTSKCTTYLTVKVFSVITFFIIFVIKYVSFALNMENVKNLLAQLQYTYNDLKDEYENIIIKKYNDSAKWYTVTLTISAICCIFAAIVIQFWSINSYDVVLSKNVSQSRHLYIITEYFIDQEKHFYVIVLHKYTALCIGYTSMIGIGTMLITYLQHVCGMFRISSYRIKHVMGINMLQNITSENENLILKGIIYAVDMHQQAMKLSELLVSKFEIMLFCLIIIGVISLSLNLFRITTFEDINKFVLIIFFVYTSILYMFLANYTGQKIMDHTNYIFVTAYSVQWYLAPLHIQRIILFLLQRGAKNFTLSVGGLFIGSLECFATLVKTSVSYFTVMYSIQ